MGGTDAPASAAICHGPSLTLAAETPVHPAAALAARVAEFPDGLIQTYFSKGHIRSQTFAEAWRRSSLIAGGLIDFGVQPGQPVVLLIEDVVDLVPAFWACVRAGFLAVPLQSAAHEALHGRGSGAYRSALARLGRPPILVSGNFEAHADALAQAGGGETVALAQAETGSPDWNEDRSPCDPLCLIPTSGSTGTLKLVALGPTTCLYRHFASQRTASFVAHHFLGTSPLDSVGGHLHLFPRYRAMTHVPISLLAARPRAVLDAVEQLSTTAASLTNSLAKMIVEDARTHDFGGDLSSLRHIGLGGETIGMAVVQQLQELLASHGASPDIIRTGYGTTETSLLVSTAGPPEFSGADSSAVRLGSCMPGVSLRIVGERDTVLRDGEIGEVQVRCPQAIFSGYWGEPSATRDCFTDDGWWRTGDLGRLTLGELTLHGRTKETLVLHGKKYSLAEIETAMDEVLAPAERAFACAIHWPDEAHERLAIALALDESGAARRDEVTALIQSAIVRRFGIRAAPIVATSPGDIPFTASGKVRRAELAKRIQSGVLSTFKSPPARLPVTTSNVTASAEVELKLARIWREVMNIKGDLNRNADFFGLGGDSLRSVTLHAMIAEEFGKEIPAERFFAAPTFETLLRLVTSAEFDDASQAHTPGAVTPWPLPRRLQNDLLMELETWPGERPTRGRLIVGLNTKGTEAPLFWAFQVGFEFSQLAKAIGADQPLYGLRSGHAMISYEEDEVQALALRYVSEISEVCPDGPLYIGGNCAGSSLAVAMAQHLLRRGRHIPLLVLMETASIPPQPYAGPVLLVHGRDSIGGNPYKRFRNPEITWRRMYADYVVAEVPGSYGEMFTDENVFALAATLTQSIAEAQPHTFPTMSRSARRVHLSAEGLPPAMRRGEQRTIAVKLRNASAMTWSAWEGSGLELGSRWLEGSEVVRWIDGRVPLPELLPGAEVELALPITSPRAAGKYVLAIDVVEEGHSWFNAPRSAPLCSLVQVGPRLLALLSRRKWLPRIQRIANGIKARLR